MFQPEAAKPDHTHLVCTGCLCLLRLKLSLVHTEAHGLYQVGSHNPNSMNPSSGRGRSQKLWKQPGLVCKDQEIGL